MTEMERQDALDQIQEIKIKRLLAIRSRAIWTGNSYAMLRAQELLDKLDASWRDEWDEMKPTFKL